MAIFIAEGGPDAVIGPDRTRELLQQLVRQVPDTSRALVVAPDTTRLNSAAGVITDMLFGMMGREASFDVLPALGTHDPMSEEELRMMYGDRLPLSVFKVHNWRTGLHRFGVVPADFVHRVSNGALQDYMPDYDIPVEANRLIVHGGYSAIFSVGQVVPHEVVGMANGFKNILVGAGGRETINRTHFLGAVYGMEKMMGRCDTPVRAVLNYAHEHYLKDLRIVYVLTVIGSDESGRHVMRGLYAGDDHEAFRLAADLSVQVNVDLLDEPLCRAVVYLGPAEFRSTWLGNKAVYRTRMAMDDNGELIVVAPGLRKFGEDPEIDGLIRKYGYRGTPATLRAVTENEDLRDNLSAAAHLIHGSSEGRFRIIYATDPAKLSRDEIEGVGFEWMDLSDALEKFRPEGLKDGFNDDFFYISNPALGLWSVRDRF